METFFQTSKILKIMRVSILDLNLLIGSNHSLNFVTRTYSMHMIPALHDHCLSTSSLKRIQLLQYCVLYDLAKNTHINTFYLYFNQGKPCKGIKPLNTVPIIIILAPILFMCIVSVDQIILFFTTFFFVKVWQFL